MKKPPTTLAALTADPQNRRLHDDRNIAAIADSLKAVGAARSIVIDEDNVILAGNGVTQAAQAAGLKKLRVVEAAGDEVIAVRRRGLTDAQKRALALYDNRTAELATWNIEQLLADQAAGLDLGAWWTDEELAALLAGDGTPKPGKTDPDAVPEVRATDIQRGDLFELGGSAGHRLLCGDATVAADVARVMGSASPLVMVTDPPYGTHYDPTWRGVVLGDGAARSEGPVTNDDRADWAAAYALFPGAVAYVWHDWLAGALVKAGLEAAALQVRYQLVWAKAQPVFSRGHYHGQHEVCWYAVRAGSSAHWTGPRNQSSLWPVALDARADIRSEHSTQKPVECMARPIRNHGGAQEAVYDPFCGSGTAVIACEQHARRCRAIEIEPQYVQVAIDRWQAFTGQRAVKVGEGTRHTETHGRKKTAAKATPAPQAAQPPARRGRRQGRAPAAGA